MIMDHSVEVVRLRATVRDLLALSAIPEVWVGREPPALATELADLLIESLRLDFAFVRLCDPEMRQTRSEEHTSELQSHLNLVCRLLLEKKKKSENSERHDY